MRRPLGLIDLALLMVLCGACGTPRTGSADGSAAAAGAGRLPAAPSTTRAGTNRLVVLAAASLTGAFKEIGTSFEAANPGTAIAFNFAGSQQLAQQIAQGAPADVFASANTSQMDAVVQSGQVIAGTARTFVRNRLVVIYPAENPARLEALGDLAKPGLKLDLAAKEVPIGQYALQFLDKAAKDPGFGPGYKSAVLRNVVSYEQDVKAVLSKVSLGEADAGIVYTSDAAGAAAQKVGRIDIPDPLNTIATYPIAAIKTSRHADLAQKFVTYVLSSVGQTILAKYGFIPAGAPPATR